MNERVLNQLFPLIGKQFNLFWFAETLQKFIELVYCNLLNLFIGDSCCSLLLI